MEILKNNTNLNIVINTEQNFRTDLGWQENLAEFEKEVLEDIINPAKNYETVRYIHKPYDVTISGITLNQSDIWFKFYFRSGATPNYVLDYNPIGITTKENELMLKQSTESFFRLEFYKTPGVISNTGTTLTCEPPTRQNRRLVNSRNLSLPLGEKYFYTGATNSSFYIHVPVFTGSNYRNRENMYLFWFDDESTLTDTNLSGTTTLDKYVFGTGSTIQTILFSNENNDITQVNIPTGGTTLVGWVGQTFTIPNQITYYRNFYHGKNTFFMTAKFFNGKDGDIIDFTNRVLSTSHVITEEKDMYYQVDFDNYERTYQVYKYSGVTSEITSTNLVGKSTTGHTTDIEFFEKGGGIIFGTTSTPTPTPTVTPTTTVTSTPTPTPTATPTVTPTPTPTVTPTPTPTSTSLFSGSGYFASTSNNACLGSISGISGNFTGNTTSFCSSTYFTGNTFNYQSSGTYYLQYGGNYQQISITFGSNVVEVTGAGCSSCPEPDEWYRIENCFDSSTGYTDSFASNTFNLNDRVVTYLTPSKVWKVIEILTANPGGVKENVSLTTPAATGCPTLYTYYYATPKTGTTEYCTSPGYIINGVFKTTASSISSITPGSTVIYNTDGTPWVGLGNDYYYPISNTSGQNTYTLFSSINYMRVDSDGLVSSKGTFSCTGGGGFNEV